uniref:translation initiation factor IF-2-like n=1 Tax=Nyctereutes procyonoides TaxID=34880 RepID=UPI002443CBB7|nr:translation initiation factor IF-2-like [Nyctereutes procyonoides]
MKVTKEGGELPAVPHGPRPGSGVRRWERRAPAPGATRGGAAPDGRARGLTSAPGGDGCPFPSPSPPDDGPAARRPSARGWGPATRLWRARTGRGSPSLLPPRPATRSGLRNGRIWREKGRGAARPARTPRREPHLALSEEMGALGWRGRFRGLAQGAHTSARPYSTDRDRGAQDGSGSLRSAGSEEQTSQRRGAPAPPPPLSGPPTPAPARWSPPAGALGQSGGREPERRSSGPAPL